MNKAAKTNRDLKNLAYERIWEKIIGCEFAPGSILNENQLAGDLGYSRTPVREALSRLEHEGLVRIMPKKGVMITEITLQDVMQIFQVRLEIEPIALRMAGPYLPIEELNAFRERFNGAEPDVRYGFRLDTAMHLFIIEHCGNRYIIDLMRRVFHENTRVVITSKQNEICIHDARQEHLDILDLLLAKDFDTAAASMRSHVESCRRAAVDYFSTQMPYTPPSKEINYRQELNKILIK